MRTLTATFLVLVCTTAALRPSRAANADDAPAFLPHDTADEISAPAPPQAPDTAEPELRPPPKHLRLAMLELTASLTGGLIWYWRDADFNKNDWDLGWDRSSWEMKTVTFEAVRFDNNAFATNVFLHGFDGMGMYLIARGNRLSPLASFLLVTGSAIAWEYLVEYREMVSVNDIIFTPVAGFAMGEPAIRFAQFLRAGPSNPATDALAALFDPIGAVNGWTEDRRGARYDRSGPGRRSYRHRVDLGVGMGVTDFGDGARRAETELGAAVFLDMTPGSGRPGTRAHWAGPGSLVSLDVGGAVGDGQLARAHIDTRTAIAGRAWRSYDETPEGRQGDGRNLFLGLGSGFEYVARERPMFPRDQLGVVRLVGPLVAAGATRGNLRVDFLAGATYDFALVRSLAIDGLIEATGVQGLPSVLGRRRYYYGQGLSLESSLIARYRRFEAGAQAGQDAFWSIGGLDRFSEDVTRDPSAFDRRGRRRAWAAVRPFATLALRPALSAEQITRAGSVDGFARAEVESRVVGSINVGF